MRIELYVVKPYKDITRLTYEEKQAIDQLEQLKVQLCQTFGGLTESAPAKGYWLDNGKLAQDEVTIWTIVCSTVNNTYGIIADVAQKLKAICQQKVQLFVINDKAYFV